VTSSRESALALEIGAEHESIPCAICGEDGFEVVLPSQREPDNPIDVESVFRAAADEPLLDPMVRCTGCRLLYVRPRLRTELVLAGYERSTDEPFVSQVGLRERTFARCLNRVEKMAKPPGRRVFDVGAAGGSFLAVARSRGYESIGCEPSSWMCDFARDHYGLELYPGTIFDVPVPKESVHLLTLWDVLEHTPNPKDVLLRAHELLVPGGILALTYPDYSSLPARILGRRWPFLLTVHLYYFVPDTMRELLVRTGFNSLRFRAHIQTLEMGYVANRAAAYLGPLGGLLTRSIRCLRMDCLPFHYWIGQTMVVARKSS